MASHPFDRRYFLFRLFVRDSRHNRLPAIQPKSKPSEGEMTRKKFNEGFADDLWDDEQERLRFKVENQLHSQNMQLYSAEHVAGFHEGVIESSNQERAK